MYARLKIGAAMALLVLASPAHAGGLFGDGGLIRGSVGNYLDRTIENPILTPFARQATVATGTAVGAYYGGEVGAVIGGFAGHTVNDCFRGDCGRSYRATGGGGYAPTGNYSYGRRYPQYAPSYGSYGNNPYASPYGYGYGGYGASGTYGYGYQPRW